MGRTGTHSLKLALEQLLGGTCHHMTEVFTHPEEVPVWHQAMLGVEPDWADFLAGYTAIVDFPGGAVWRELAAAFPDVPVLLSTRESSEVWWRSANRTIFAATKMGPPRDNPVAATQLAMVKVMLAERFAASWSDRDTAIAAYEAHNAAVRAEIPAERLFEYQPGDGWGPLCAALAVPEPDAPFPHTNTAAEFRAQVGLPPD